MSGILDAIGRAIQKPQSVFAGGLMGALRSTGFMDDQSPYMSEVSNPLNGLMEGWKNEIHPHDLLNDSMGGESDNIGSKIMNTVSDIAIDPLMLAGPLVKSGALGTKVAGLGDAALSAGKLEEGVGTGSKLIDAAARFGRRTYQGTLATGDPLSGMGLGTIMGMGENKLAKLLPKLGGRAVEGALADTADSLPSAIKELGPAYKLDDVASGAYGRGAGAAADGEVITPEIVMRALSPQRMPELAVVPKVPELGPAQAMSMGPGFDRAIGETGQLAPEQLDELVRRLMGETGRVSPDNLTNIFRTILQGQ